MLHDATILVNWVVLHQDALLQLVGGAAGLSALAQVVLHKLNTKWGINSKAFSYTLVQILTLLAAVSAYLVDNANVGVVYPWLAVAAATVHRYLVSPYYTKKVLPYLTFLSENTPPPTSQYQAPQTEVTQPAEQPPTFVN